MSYSGSSSLVFIQDGKSPFLAAFENGHTETAQLLIEKGADKNKKKVGILLYALFRYNYVQYMPRQVFA